MSKQFISENTDFDSWENFLQAAGILLEKDFDTPRFNEFIKTRTQFEKWEEMLVQAAKHYVSRKEADNPG